MNEVKRIKTKFGVVEYDIIKADSKTDFINKIKSFWGERFLKETEEKDCCIEFEDGTKQECKKFFYCIEGYMPRDSVYECFQVGDTFYRAFAFSAFIR